jgi:methyl-accepting chemotaxis protein
VTQEAVRAVEGILKRISEISGISAAIAVSVSEQQGVTREIGANAQRFAVGNDRLSETIGQVRQAADQTGSAASQVLSSARLLQDRSADMKTLVGTFLSGVRGN